MLGPGPHPLYDTIAKCRLGYKNLCLLKKFVAQNPKLYHVTSLRDKSVRVSVHDSEETLEDAENTRLKMQ
ncbi:hypothetical protein Tco_1153239 [Tanacetum coccineum]